MKRTNFVLAIVGAALVAVGCFLMVVVGLGQAYQNGRRAGIAEASLAPPSGAMAGSHNRRLRVLGDKLAAAGYVWRSPAGDDLPNQPAAWEGGVIVNLDHPEWEWKFYREGLAHPPSIYLSGRTNNVEYWHLLEREWSQFEKELPPQSGETLRRLGSYCQAMYEEDHQGTARRPEDPAGTAELVERRKRGPQDYTVTVADQVGDYLAGFAIQESPDPERRFFLGYETGFGSQGPRRSRPLGKE